MTILDSLLHPKRAQDIPDPSAAKQLGELLGCAWELVDRNLNADQITALWLRELESGTQQGYHPMLVAADDLLLETVSDTFDENGGFDAYRAALLNAPCNHGHDILYDPENRIEFPDSDTDHSGSYRGSLQLDTLLNVQRSELRRGEVLMLLRIPVSDPCRVFAYLPFGGWNECPEADDLIAVCREWQKRYGAVPAMLSHDILQMYVPQPLTDADEALKLAAEMFAFCGDLSQGIGTDRLLAKSLVGSRFWYFWWD